MENEEKILRITYKKKIPHYNYERIVVNLKKTKNIIALSKENEIFYNLYKDLLANDFMFYFHKGTKSYFIKRKLVDQIWKRKDLISFGELFYTVEEPPKNRNNLVAPLRLVVVFSGIGAGDYYYNPNIGVRCFIKNYPTLQNAVLKNTIVMRIMDLNLSHGSHYINTDNYPHFEDDVQGAIKAVIERYDINKEDVILYGANKGGTGALYHSMLGDYKSLSVEPIISISNLKTLLNDTYFLKGLRKDSILEDLLILDKQKFQYKKMVIGSPVIPFNYDMYEQLKNENINIIDIFDGAIDEEGEVYPETIAEQTTIINSLLLESNEYKRKVQELKGLSDMLK